MYRKCTFTFLSNCFIFVCNFACWPSFWTAFMLSTSLSLYQLCYFVKSFVNFKSNWKAQCYNNQPITNYKISRHTVTMIKSLKFSMVSALKAKSHVGLHWRSRGLDTVAYKLFRISKYSKRSPVRGQNKWLGRRRCVLVLNPTSWLSTFRLCTKQKMKQIHVWKSVCITQEHTRTRFHSLSRFLSAACRPSFDFPLLLWHLFPWLPKTLRLRYRQSFGKSNCCC